MLTDDSTPIDVEIHTSESAFQLLCKEWNELAAHQNPSSLFFYFQWFDAAWEWKKQDSMLKIIIVRSSAGIIAIAPFTTRAVPLFGIKIHQLEFLTVPDTQECDILCRPGCEQTAAISISRYLKESTDWDIAKLGKLLPDAFCMSALPPALADCSLRHSVVSNEENFMIPMADDWSTYYSRRSRRLKKGNNLISNRLKQAFEKIEVQWLHGKNICEDELRQVVEDLAATSSKSWKGDCTETTFDNKGPQAFLSRLVKNAAEQGWLSVWRLELNSQCVATELQLIHNGTIAALRADFDNELSKHSPGTYLNWKILERLFDEQSFVEYRMGPGSNNYKLRWSEKTLSLSEVTVYGSSLKARYVYFVEKVVRPVYRKLKSRASTPAD